MLQDQTRFSIVYSPAGADDASDTPERCPRYDVHLVLLGISMRPDKQKVVDEVWDDERIESFLHKSVMGDERSVDYSALLNAYRSMRAEDFERFLNLFVAAGRDVNAAANDGKTVLALLDSHRLAEPFRATLRAHGALDND